MSKAQVIDYVMSTPNNTNPNILSLMLDELTSDSGSSGESSSKAPAIYYYPNVELNDIWETLLENPEEIAPFSLLITQEEKGGSGQELYYFYPNTQDGYDSKRSFRFLGNGSWVYEDGILGIE